MNDALHQQIQIFDPSRPITDNFTPPASWYTSADFLELERDSVFKHNWIVVGRVDQVAATGDYFTLNLLRKPILVTRDEQGDLRAYYNVCSHHGTRVARGEGCAQQFVCPYHGWTYALDGKLRKAPRAGRIEDLTGKDLGLKPLPCRAWGPFVWVCFGDDPPDFDATFAQMNSQIAKFSFDGLRFIKRVSYTIDCNWKVFMDNYLDGGYHVPHMHGDLASGLTFDAYTSDLGDVFSIQSCPGAGDDAGRLGAMAYYTWVYPNFAMNRYGPWMDTNLVLPLGRNQCLTIFDYYCQGEVAEPELAQALRESDQVQQEDIEVCLMVQEGLDSGVYHRGVYAPRYETPMYHFHQLLARDFRQAQDIEV